PRQLQVGPLADTLGDWTGRAGPTYLRLARAIGDAVAQGQLAPGWRLPAERALAAHLRVARGTVVSAYDTLREQGVVETRRGSGTVLLGRRASAQAHRAPLLSRLVDGGGVPIDLAVGAPELAEDELTEVGVSMRSAWRLVPPHGYAPMGVAALREALAMRFSRRGVPSRPDEIIVTGGAQGALSLIAASFLRPGDRVLVEAPTYPAAIEAFARAGARVEGVERDHSGPVLASLEGALARGPVRLIYLIPTGHNPTGEVMSEGRRRAVLRVAREARALVLEDGVMEDLLYDGAAPVSLAALDPEAVLAVGSLSKSVWGALRVGWIRAPSELVLRMGRLKACLDLGSPALGQAAALEIVERLPELTARRRALFEHRVGVLCAELESQLPEWSFRRPRGGLSVWLKLPRGSADDLAQLALRRGVAIASGRAAAPGDEFPSHVRLCAGPPPELLCEGVSRLAAAWKELTALPQPAHDERVMV
ncbi:MAG: PLP-dependent aminotransferase family protein, partial [Solirubrobacteraceae bacterium]